MNFLEFGKIYKLIIIQSNYGENDEIIIKSLQHIRNFEK